MHDFSLYRTALSQTDWQTAEQSLPQAVAMWLLHTDSLTEKMQQYCNHLQVNIVGEGWQAVNFADFSVNSTACWQREVLLSGDNSAWIFAQTLIPKATVQAVAEDVLTLGQKPIGLWLFPKSPERQKLEWRWDRQTRCFARRSVLALNGYPLEIRELFLPQFPFDHNSRLTDIGKQ